MKDLSSTEMVDKIKEVLSFNLPPRQVVIRLRRLLKTRKFRKKRKPKEIVAALVVLKKRSEQESRRFNSSYLKKAGEWGIYVWCTKNGGWEKWCKKLKVKYCNDRTRAACKHNWSLKSAIVMLEQLKQKHQSLTVRMILASAPGLYHYMIKYHKINWWAKRVDFRYGRKLEYGRRLSAKERGRIKLGIMNKRLEIVREPHKSILDNQDLWGRIKDTCKGIVKSRKL